MKLDSAEMLERELKFRAVEGSLPQFCLLGNKLDGKFVLGAGADCYWVNPMEPDLAPVRHRYSQGFGELTAKQQTIPGSNVSRREVNVRLDDAQLREMEAILPMMGYEPRLKISKVSHIFFCRFVVLSWYSVMGMDGQLLYMEDGSPAQYVEVELREDVNWVPLALDHHGRRGMCIFPEGHFDDGKRYNHPEEFCTLVLDAWAFYLNKLGIIKGAPIQKSLWEMFGEKL